MPDILQDFPIQAEPQRVFAAVSQPAMLDTWWTLRSSGRPEVGQEYELDFGPEYQWRSEVTKVERGVAIEFRFTVADADWTGTTLGIELAAQGKGTLVRFAHRGWPVANEHYRVSCHCWALYLRLLRRHLETGELVPYEARLSA